MTEGSSRTRSWWGWGWEEEAVGGEELERLRGTITGLVGARPELHDPPTIESLDLHPPRVAAPTALASICTSDTADRAAHTHGKAFRDVSRNLLGRLDTPPDVIARPRTEAEVSATLEWCEAERLAVIPYGGGSSVVGGIEPLVGDSFRGVVSLDMGAMDRVLEIDGVSLAARVQAGALGPVLEDQLRPHGLTLRHFPQSFEFSTLGGWLATRAGGHFATLYTHIDDLTEAMRVITPAGLVQTRRLPGSGAGPSQDRLFLGSEVALGIITEGWMRLVQRPRWRGSVTATFRNFTDGVAAARAVAQSRLYPTNCRLLDGNEAALSAGAAGVGALLVLAFESADHPVQPWLERAAALCRGQGAQLDQPRYSEEQPGAAGRGRDGAAGAWRKSFLRAPYQRDALARMGMVAETFETSCTWDRFGALHEMVMEVAGRVVEEVCGPGLVTCRFTHVYPDGPAPYFSVLAPGRWGDQVQQWDAVKSAVSEVLLDAGGTITHHHAVGRVHRPWYDRQRPDLFGAALQAAKDALDPSGILNPGVLVGP